MGSKVEKIGIMRAVVGCLLYKVFTVCAQNERPKPKNFQTYKLLKGNWPSSNKHAYLMSSVLKLETMVLIKLSLMITARIDFQSLAFSPSRRQIDSNASFTSSGGFAIERTSTRCCLLIDFTAIINRPK
jgi:hypothetical protein